MNTASSSFFGSGYREQAKTFMAFVDAYHADEALRKRTAEDPRAVLMENGIDVQVGPEVQVSENTAEDFYLVMPPDPNVELSDETLEMVAGGKSASSLGSAGSAASLGTVCTSASCASSAGSVGTAGSAGG